MKLVILFLLGGWANPFGGSIQLQTPVCPNSSFICQVTVQSDNWYQWEWQYSGSTTWQGLGDPQFLPAGEKLQGQFSSQILPGTLRVKSWRTDDSQMWFSEVLELSAPLEYPSVISGNQQVCTGQDIKLKVDFPASGTYQWERSINGLDFSPMTETSKYTRVKQSELVIRGSSGVDHLIYFRNHWISPEGCAYVSKTVQVKINQLSTISPTPSTLICEGQTLRLQTQNIQGNWIKNDWFVSDSSGILRQVPDSNSTSLTVNYWAIFYKNVQVRGFFETIQLTGTQITKGVCTLNSQRTYTVSPAPKSPSDTTLTQCGTQRKALLSGGDWSLSAQGPWQKTEAWIDFNKPDTVTRWQRLLDSKGCASKPYKVQYIAHSIPQGVLHWSREMVCFSDSLLPLTFTKDSTIEVRMRWANESEYASMVFTPSHSDSLYWFWRDTVTLCESQVFNQWIAYKPEMTVQLKIPSEPICPNVPTTFLGTATDETAQWIWSSPYFITEAQTITRPFFENQSGQVKVTNACESRTFPWNIEIIPPPVIELIEPKTKINCEGDSVVWSVSASSMAKIHWFHNQLGKIGDGVSIKIRATLGESQVVWYTWEDECGRSGQSQPFQWTVFPRSLVPLLADTVAQCMGIPLPKSENDVRWIWSGFQPEKVGVHSVWLKAVSPEGCASDSIQKWVWLTPKFSTTVVVSRSWLCETGLKNREAFVRNTSEIPVHWIDSSVDRWEVGWRLRSPGVYRFTQTLGACKMEDSVVINKKVVANWIEKPEEHPMFCPNQPVVISLPLENESEIFWYETAFQEMQVHQGNSMVRSNQMPIWVRKRGQFNEQEYCESEAIKISPQSVISVASKWNTQDRCMGNSASFEVIITGNGVGSWWQKLPNREEFEQIPNSSSPLLRLTSVGNAKNPDKSLYKFQYETDQCLIQSNEMQLNVMGFKEPLPSAEVCEWAKFPLNIPSYSGQLHAFDWQTRPENSGSWVSSALPEKMMWGSSYWRVRAQFKMENGQFCSQTSDDARIIVQTARGNLTTQQSSCPGSLLSYQWTPIQSGGSWSWNQSLTTQSQGILGAGQYYFQSFFKSCQWDTTFSVQVTPPKLPRPDFSSSSQFYLSDTLTWKPIVSSPDLVWLSDSVTLTRLNPPTFSATGPFEWIAAYESNGCLGPVGLWNGRVLRPLLVQVNQLKVLQCKGLSMDLKIDSKGEGDLTYQWFQKSHQNASWIPIIEWPTRNMGERTSQLRLYNVGNFPHWDGTWYRCLVTDSLGFQWSDSVQLEVWEPRGSLLANQYVCEDEKKELDIRAFRGWRPGEVEGFWEKREVSGWQKWVKGYQINIHEQTNGLYRYAWLFPNSKQDTCKIVSDDFLIEHVQKPSAPSVLESEVCQSERTLLPGYPISRFNWYSTPDAFSAKLSSVPRISFSQVGEIQYWISSRGSYCESDRVAITWRVNPTPNAPISLVPKEFEGYSLTFQAEGMNLKWYRTTRAESQTQAPVFTQSGVARFYVTQTNAFGCESEKVLIESRITWPVTIEEQPQNLFECSGNALTFKFKLKGQGILGYQWFRKRPSEDFKEIPEATSLELKISSAGSIADPDSSVYFCRISLLNGRQIFTDTVQLRVNSILPTSKNISICSDQTVALSPKLLTWTGKVRSIIWEGQLGSTWRSLGSSDTILRDSVVSLTTIVRARMTFQSELNETCVRTSNEFTLLHVPLQKSINLPDIIQSCDTARSFPLRMGWELKEENGPYFLREKGTQGCWSEWKEVEWKLVPCWADLNECDSVSVQLSDDWTYLRNKQGFVWGRAKGKGQIIAFQNTLGYMVWNVEGKGTFLMPPQVDANIRWMISNTKNDCEETSSIWEVLLFPTGQDSITIDSSVSISWTKVPYLPEWKGTPKLQGHLFWFETKDLPYSWQIWDKKSLHWKNCQFPLDTSMLTSRFRYRHIWNETMFSWVEIPSLAWRNVPTECQWRGERLVSHNLQYPLQVESRNTQGQLIESFQLESPNDIMGLSTKSFVWPLKIITFVDRWGRTCTSRQWTE